jgi:hypothetical protein
MSALGHKRTSQLFDHLIGNVQQTKWHSEPKRFGGLEIDDQLEPGRLQDRQVGRLLAFEDSADIGADLRIDLPGNDSVAVKPPAAVKLLPTEIVGRR